MALPGARKGAGFEVIWCNYVSTFVPTCERRVKKGMNDCGDVAGLRDWTIELKATNSFSLTGLTEAEKEAAKAGTPWYAYGWKWANHSVYKSVVSTHLSVYAEVLEHIYNLEEENKKLRYALKMVKGGAA